MKSIKPEKILSIIIISILLSVQVLLPLSAQAATDWTTPTSNPTNGLTSSIVNPQVLLSVISCTGVVNKIVSAATNFIQDEVDSAITSITEAIRRKALAKAKQIAAEQAKKQALERAADALGSAGSVSVFGFQVNLVIPAATLQEQASTVATLQVFDTSALDAINDATQQSITNANNAFKKKKQEDCLNGIAVALARAQLEKITRSTLNWVGSGFKGNPLFVQNIDSFMNGITQTILNKETKFFGDPLNRGLYPYGQTYAQSEVNAYRSQNNFDSSVRQNLTNYLVPGATPQSFANDFSQGGWNGWLALTQNPQNNPLGFTMVVSQHTADMQTTEKTNTEKEVTANGGYLSQRKCTVYGLNTERTITKLNTLQDQIKSYQDEANTLCPQVAQATDPTSKQIAQQVCNDAQNNLKNAKAAFSAASSDPANKDCTSWNVVTPGSAIRDKVSKTINSPETQLELVKTVDDALTYLFTALLNRFQNQGLSSLVTGPFEDVSAGFTSNIGDGGTTSTGPLSGTSSGSSYSGPGSFGAFDITKDLAAIIQSQKDYISATGKAIPVAQSVLPALGQLDYCIPGPNPNWEQNAPTNIASSAQLNSYNDDIEKTFGVSSPMQSPGDSAYLQMSRAGLAITRNLTADDATITQEINDLNDSVDTANANITTLTEIKRQVDVIVAAATRRRDAQRTKDGLPPISSCVNTQ
jgi:hypothetical protein